MITEQGYQLGGNAVTVQRVTRVANLFHKAVHGRYDVEIRFCDRDGEHTLSHIRFGQHAVTGRPTQKEVIGRVDGRETVFDRKREVFVVAIVQAFPDGTRKELLAGAGAAKFIARLGAR